ncbi:MBL fold metallo-hydrolase [Alteromonadaceae bacterium M269]|nr:MBL fold metallo-hydrolase [Alteromonadaceae bacterium M269]
MSKSLFSIHCLGTSSGVPTKKRNVSATALTLPDTNAWVLVDCGEGAQHQLLHSKLTLANLDTIFITHMHGDHCYGLPGIIASSAMSGRKEPLNIVGPKEIQQFYQAVQETSQLYTPFPIRFIQTEEMGTLTLPNTQVTACLLSHRITSHAFCFRGERTFKKLLTEKLLKDGVTQGPIWGQIQQGKDVELDNGKLAQAKDYVEQISVKRKVVIAGDNDKPHLLESTASDADVIMHEATYTDEILQKVGPGPQHSSAKLVAEFAESIKLPNLLLTHFSARFQDPGTPNGIDLLESEARSFYNGNLYLASDFDKYDLLENGTLIKS